LRERQDELAEMLEPQRKILGRGLLGAALLSPQTLFDELQFLNVVLELRGTDRIDREWE
jgi:hypothetical protein